MIVYNNKLGIRTFNITHLTPNQLQLRIDSYSTKFGIMKRYRKLMSEANDQLNRLSSMHHPKLTVDVLHRTSSTQRSFETDVEKLTFHVSHEINTITQRMKKIIHDSDMAFDAIMQAASQESTADPEAITDHNLYLINTLNYTIPESILIHLQGTLDRSLHQIYPDSDLSESDSEPNESPLQSQESLVM